MRKAITILVAGAAIALAGCDTMTPRERQLTGGLVGATAGLLTASALSAGAGWTLVTVLAGATAGTLVARNAAHRHVRLCQERRTLQSRAPAGSGQVTFRKPDTHARCDRAPLARFSGAALTVVSVGRSVGVGFLRRSRISRSKRVTNAGPGRGGKTGSGHHREVGRLPVAVLARRASGNGFLRPRGRVDGLTQIRGNRQVIGATENGRVQSRPLHPWARQFRPYL